MSMIKNILATVGLIFVGVKSIELYNKHLKQRVDDALVDAFEGDLPDDLKRKFNECVERQANDAYNGAFREAQKEGLSEAECSHRAERVKISILTAQLQ